MREATGYTATYRHTISVEEGGEEGNCLHIRQGYHHVIEGFPDCVVADAVINFFMGRTEKVQQVGFDPRLARQGHLGESLFFLSSMFDVFCILHSCGGTSVTFPVVKIDQEKLSLSIPNSVEFFVDALGSLHIGSCSNIIVNHASKIILPWTKTDSQKSYEKFRYSSSMVKSSLDNEIYYFKNRFKCMTSQ